ncbi:3-oxoacyl-ACP synthase III family protein [Prauserella cavernicola]|uniref:Ketoacyl-ACP synthase III n=1 Tax=Prauserella cavernicola TaxID=2800127 RepID=A0A934V868_9PSEU|nr:ketoacyl-ACP synthase III [Prauserella cavernicola]MBK1787990.1 ketoacyl-ACP synthase III [Prauserella cavernicola]
MKSDVEPGVGILGVGSFLPGAALANSHVSRNLDVEPGWIEDRTGIVARHRAAEGEGTSELATRASAEAIAQAGTRPDMVVLATVTPDRPVPATACAVQERLGLHGVPAVDVNAACSGFVYAVVTAWGAMTTGVCRSPLVVGADVFTRHVDPADRRTAPLFGDGAGAVVLGRVPPGFGILAAELWADGSQQDIAHVPPPEADARWFHMDGGQVRDVVLNTGPKLLETVLSSAGARADELDRVIVHQANPKLVQTLARSAGLDERVVPLYGAHTGNTASASLPVSLALAHRDRPMVRGSLVALVAVGAGMTAGAMVVRWY